jgi:hypothetical protein
MASVNKNGLLSSTSVCFNGASNSNIFARLGESSNFGNLSVTGDVTASGDLIAGDDLIVNGDATITGTLTVSGDAVIPQPMKSTSAVSSGSTVSFTNTAEVLTNSSVTASRTGYYQFMAQFTSTSIGSFDAGTDVMTFYADISGGALTPIVGSIKDITNTTATTFETTFSGYAYATAGDVIRLIHIDTGTFTITDGALYVLWQYMGPGTGLA